MKNVLPCKRGVYPHACAEAYTAARNHNWNKLNTQIADGKRLKIVLRQIIVVFYTISVSTFLKDQLSSKKKNFFHLFYQ